MHVLRFTGADAAAAFAVCGMGAGILLCRRCYDRQAGRWMLLIAAGALLAAALLWNAHLSATSEGARLCRTVNEFGYALHPDDLYPAGAWNDTSIRALLPETELAEASPHRRARVSPRISTARGR
jgi:hypothetical protein